VDSNGVAYQIKDGHSFSEAWRDGIRFIYAFTVPSGLDNWREFGALPFSEIRMDYAAKQAA
jgi:hypothetical protein